MSLIADTFFEVNTSSQPLSLIYSNVGVPNAVTHCCTKSPSNKLSFRSGVLGQYFSCHWCGKATWEPIPEENENSN